MTKNVTKKPAAKKRGGLKNAKAELSIVIDGLRYTLDANLIVIALVAAEKAVRHV